MINSYERQLKLEQEDCKSAGCPCSKFYTNSPETDNCPDKDYVGAAYRELDSSKQVVLFGKAVHFKE